MSQDKGTTDKTALNAMMDVSSRIQGMQRSRRNVSTVSLNVGQDGYKEKQLRAKELRQNRIAGLKTQSRFLVETAALILNKTPEYILDGVYDADSHISLLDSVVAEGGLNCVVICNAILPPLKMETGRYIQLIGKEAKQPMERAYVADAYRERVMGDCVAVFRIKSNKAVELKSVTEEFQYVPICAKQEGGNVVSGIFQVMRDVYVNALMHSEAWGDINPPNPHSATIIKKYISEIMLFVDYLEKTKLDLDCCTYFNIDIALYEDELVDEDKMKIAITKTSVLEGICTFVKEWLKQITIVLVQSQQLRREAHNIGPLAELDYWRRQLTSFTSIVEHVNSIPCRMYINTLTLAKSKLIKKWLVIDNKVTDYCNEAADNVKYLYALEKYCEPLYRCTPPELEEHLPALIYTIRMVFATSRYYNTTNQISTLLVKVTNQILNSCMMYLTNNGKRTIWNQPKVDFIKKAKVCLKMYNFYRYCYNDAQHAMIEAADEHPFNCSEMYIFGKFETFKKRLNKIMQLFQTYIKYHVLTKTTLEGIEEHSAVFVKLYKTISSKTYDALDHRKPDFDKDFKIYKESVSQQEIQLENFMITSIAKCPTTENALQLLVRFEKLELECLYIEDQYFDLISKFTEEIECLRDRYNEERQDPEVPRNMPPVAGRIMWIRFYSQLLKSPMADFQKHKEIINHPQTQRCIKLYNVMAIVFLEFELIYHRAWCANVGQVRLGLTAPLLIRHPRTNMYIVNFSLFIPECIREVEYMWQLHLSVPDVAQIIAYCKDKLYGYFERIKFLVERNNKIRRSMPKLFLPLLRAQLIKLERAFQAGMSTITWTSLEIPSYCDNIVKVMDEVELFVKEVCDMKEARIDIIFQSIGKAILVLIPDEAVDPLTFIDDNFSKRDALGEELQSKSSDAERAVIDLIHKFLESIPSPAVHALKDNWLDMEKALKQVTSATRMFSDDAGFQAIENPNQFELPQIINECNELFAYFNQKCLDALIRCTRNSLDILKKKSCVSSFLTMTDDPDEQDKLKPLMLTTMILQIPIVAIKPNLDDIQTAITQVVLNAIMDVHRSIFVWGQQKQVKEEMGKGRLRAERSMSASRRSMSSVGGLRSYFRSVAEHKDIVRAVMSLQGVMYNYKSDIEKLTKRYHSYSFLWAEDRAQQVHQFIDTNPLVVTIRDELKKYENQIEEILNLPRRHIVGSIQVNMEKIKLALHVEAVEWKVILGKHLCLAYKVRVQNMIQFIKDRLKTLHRKIKDLDDVRLAMVCLDLIREEFINMDMELDLIEETYTTFASFCVDVPKEDAELVDGLRYAFQNMLLTAAEVQQKIVDMQGPLQRELTEGVATFNNDVLKFDEDYEAFGPMTPGLSAREASDRVILFQARFDELWRRFEMYSSGEKLFGLEVNDYPILHQKKREFNLLSKLYSLYVAVMNSIDGYFEIPWNEIDIEGIINQLTDFDLRCRKLPKAMKDWPAFIDLKQKIDDFNQTCPLLELMADKAMKDRHWRRLETLLACPLDVESPTFTLQDIMEAPLLQNKEDVEDICISAVKEKDIEAKLKQVIADWAVVNLTFSNFKNRGELLIKPQETMDIITALEDSLMVLNSLASNRYNLPFKREIMLWIQKLVNTTEILEKWMQVQTLWMYLEAVFVGGDIAKQLPAEAKRFATIDKSYVKIMYRARDMPNAVECCTSDDTLKQLLPHLYEQLEACQKSLSGYLETKRLIFPRFFFVSDPVLLEILGQSSDPHSIQPHLLSIFDAIYTVDFDDKDRIVGMNSANGESMLLERTVTCIGGVEIWLNILLESMKDTIKNVIATISQSMLDPEFNFIVGFWNYCGQAGLLGLQILWTTEAEYALKKSRADRYIMRVTNQRFLDLLNSLIELTVTDLKSLDRTRIETMITIHVHQRDIFDDLVKLRIRSPVDFEWQKQARFYYLEDTDDCVISITDVDFIYQNEYLGITERLVITPLTDRCYITLAQAIGMSMGGAPAGPAGTGKTETTKDMGRALGKLVIVFNCSDQMDFRGLGRIYKGLAESGTWGCFDEFNRVELPVLSVAAQQIYICLTARREKKTHFIFSDGDHVSLNPEFAFIITMNPGYAGRQELPENLKIQFRSVAMMVPDRQIIIRVKLASCGFKDNIVLARKFFTLYKLCEEQLSKQVHYDFGLRNILSVLRTMGSQKRANPESTEETIMMRVLKEMNVSKLVDEDEPLFISLIEDLFPGIKLSQTVHKEMQKAIAQCCEVSGLVNHPDWNLKIIQLYETSLVRHGLMTMGPTGSGKTTCIHTLMAALTLCGKPHREMRMNPKAITAPQMFGRLDVATNDWTDGIFSTLWRRTLKIKWPDNTWIVLDGPVDAVWIENLNSVLDDNKTLTLANGDRISMAHNSKLVFEPDNVDNASPATVSRMGMVFLSASVLKWQPILEGWLRKRPAREADVLRNSFNKVYNEVHSFVQQRLPFKMIILEAIYIRQCVDVLTGLLQIEVPSGKAHTDRHLERLFVFAMMWSLGAVLELDARSRMAEFMTKLPVKMEWPKSKEAIMPFEFMVNETGVWQHWSECVESYIYPSDSVPEYSSILVPNVDNVCTAFLIDTISKQDKAVLLIGEQGTAKTVMLKSYMSQYDSEFKMFKVVNFSFATTPNLFQRIIESYVEKRVGTTYGPPNGRAMTVFIDDINMPVVNEWGDQVTNEIVREMMETGGFYSLDRPGEFTTIKDIQVFGAMIHPGGGRNDIPPRLKRQFNIFNCTLPSDMSMDKIFGVIASGYYCRQRFDRKVVEFIPKLVPITRRIWQNTKIKMLPTPAKFHYVFNLRDLSRIWEGMLFIKREECNSISTVLKLWYHESIRVIGDRFTTYADKDWFYDNFRKVAKEDLGDLYSEFPEEEKFFVNFLREPVEATGDEAEDFSTDAPKVYEELPNWNYVQTKLLTFMEQFNEQIRGANLDLVFFHDAMIHLIIISRIINTPRGNALLVGVGGSGKQSLTKLASFIANFKFYQITLTRVYNLNNFMEDIKVLYRVAGLQGLGISFIFTDNDIKDESFLEYLNNILSSGEIANLFPKDEMDEILNELTPIMKKLAPRRVPVPDVLYEYFIIRSRANLHLVLCFSPVGEKFRSRALKFPGLISGCTMDWFQKWPKNALIAVANHFLSEFEVVCSAETKIQLIEIMGIVQDDVSDVCGIYYDRFRRQAHVTPKSYLSFLEGYKTIYKEKHSNIAEMAKRMTTGLTKLVEAAKSVDVLKQELEIKEKEIKIATAKAEEVLEEVARSAAAAEEVKQEVLVVKERALLLVKDIEADQVIAEKKLEAARPALEAAEAALQTIKAADIATVRKLGKPPFLITLIMDAAIILFKKKIDPIKPDPEKQFLTPSWAESLKVMADSRFLFNLVNYPKDEINAEIIDLLQPYFRFPQYTFEAAKTACGNVAGLISWTIAMAQFYSVNKDVLPLKANLAVQQAKYLAAKKELDAAEALLASKEAELAIVKKTLDAAMELQAKVLEDAAKCQQKMDAASALINGLSGERVRWTEQSALFKSEIERLIGDILLLTGFLSYSGPFNQEFRALLINNWIAELIRRKIPVSMNLNIADQLTDNATIGEWNLNGLPNDELSIQNGIIVTKAARFPLLIDPQTQGKIWIKNMEKQNNLIISSLNHKYFRNHLEDSVSLGFPLLIEDIGEELDPAMDNILERNFIKIGTTFKVKIGDKEVDVTPGFKIYITTKLPNPAYTPEVSARTSIIDFTVTMLGLEDQLLGRVILTEKNELETERTNLIMDVTSNRRKIQELEANLLHKLTTIQGSLVEDVSLIQVLNVTKATATEVKEKLDIARETEIKINAAREEFRPVATRGSVLYFLVCNMSLVCSMYQTSLAQFLERFDISMERSEKSPITYRRIGHIIEYLTFDVFKFISRGFYEKHKLLFTILMTLKIDLQRQYITYDEFQTFIKGGAALDLNACPSKPFKWVSDVSWLNLVQLSTLRLFANILSQVSNNEKAWKAWFDKEAPEEEVIPDGYNTIDVFRKMLIVRSWSPDRMIAQSQKYIAQSMGTRFSEAVIVNYEQMVEESRPLVPLIGFLAMGSDPTPSIEMTAKRMEVVCNSISMGQGQEVHARKLVTKALVEGIWVLLQNCHLGLPYMVELLDQFMELEKDQSRIHETFRVWITTEEHPAFPISLLQMAIKYTNEPPSGMKAGLMRTYNAMSQDFLDYSDLPFYLPMIYATSFLHSVVQERRKFGPLGWNIPYEFNSSDWLSCCYFTQNHLDDLEPGRGVSWTTVRYMVSEVQYGGRVTDDYDKRLLVTFAKAWFGDHLFTDDWEFFRGYGVMKFKNIPEYIEEMDKMKISDPPQVYGLHSNADMTYQRNTTAEILDTILSIQPKEASAGGGETRESVVYRQCKEMLAKVPPSYDPHEVKERLRIMGSLNSMSIFLRQEIDRMQKVIDLVRTTLKDLILAIDGTIIMNENLRDSLDNIFDARVPNIWLKNSWASSTLGFWFTEFLERNAQFSSWCFICRPVSFWMTGFFNPQGFLTAMRQEVTRAHKGWALDMVTLHNDITKYTIEEVKTPPLEGVYVHGLFLDGAGWDRRNSRLCESILKVLYTNLPVAHVYAINSTAPKDPKLYVCPVYKKICRTDLTYITPLWLPTVRNPDHWVLRGVAIICDIK